MAGPLWRLLPVSLLAVALITWRLSLLHVDVSKLGSYGLPPALPTTWYVVLALAVVGAAATITASRASGLMMAGYLIVVAIILYGTVPVLSAPPHYTWVYKHIGVVRYLEAHGKVNPNIDIYNRWPGFFALAAMFTLAAGRANPVTYVEWAELFFLLLDCALLAATVKAITRDARIAAGAAILFVVTNWVGQTYYSPQAFAFVLGLALILIILRQLRTRGATYSNRLTRLIERVGRVPQLSVQMEETARWPRWAAVTAALSLDAVIVTSHQLTPYMLLVGVALLALAGVVRPWWVLMCMAMMTFAYLAINFNFIQRHFGLFTSINPAHNVYVEKYKQTQAAGKAFNTHVELVLVALLYLGSSLAVIRLLRRGLFMRALPFVAFAVAPFSVLLAQNYGGEAPLRIILFSSPWCAALISWALATVTRPRMRPVLMTVTAAMFTTLFVPSFLGQEELNIVSAAEVRATEWLYYHARPGYVLLAAGPGFLYGYGGAYDEFGGPGTGVSLTSFERFQGRQLGAADIAPLVRRMGMYGPQGYVVFTKVASTWTEVLGVTPAGALGRLEAAIARSPAFRLWYSNSDVQIYEVSVPRSTVEGSGEAVAGHTPP